MFRQQMSFFLFSILFYIAVFAVQVLSVQPKFPFLFFIWCYMCFFSWCTDTPHLYPLIYFLLYFEYGLDFLLQQWNYGYLTQSKEKDDFQSKNLCINAWIGSTKTQLPHRTGCFLSRVPGSYFTCKYFLCSITAKKGRQQKELNCRLT